MDRLKLRQQIARAQELVATSLQLQLTGRGLTQEARILCEELRERCRETSRLRHEHRVRYAALWPQRKDAKGTD